MNLKSKPDQQDNEDEGNIIVVDKIIIIPNTKEYAIRKGQTGHHG